MVRTLFRPASALAVVALLALAGCGDGDQSTSAGAQAASASSTAGPTTSTTVLATTTTTVPSCADVSFSSNTDDKATNIKATGLGCTEAEALVGKVGAKMRSLEEPSKVEADGFLCLRTSARSGDHGPPVSTAECTSGTKKVTYTRTS